MDWTQRLGGTRVLGGRSFVASAVFQEADLAGPNPEMAWSTFQKTRFELNHEVSLALLPLGAGEVARYNLPAVHAARKPGDPSPFPLHLPCPNSANDPFSGTRRS